MRRQQIINAPHFVIASRPSFKLREQRLDANVFKTLLFEPLQHGLGRFPIAGRERGFQQESCIGGFALHLPIVLSQLERVFRLV